MLRGLPSSAARPSSLSTWLSIVLIAGICCHVAAQQGRTAYVVNALQQEFEPSNNTFQTLRGAMETQQYDTILLTHNVTIWVSCMLEQHQQLVLI
jgi:hypothetical protein